MPPRTRYEPPARTARASLLEVLDGVRPIPAGQRDRLALPGFASSGPIIYYAGELALLRQKCVAIVGSRQVSPEGAARARRLARELAAAGVVVVSGLAEGVDTAALEAAIDAGGKTVAVIGTPLDRVYPAQNAALQERIYREHLLVSPFPSGTRVIRSNFPTRNKLMAALTDATVIIEASDTSGSLHQAAECAPGRLDRWLFIARSVVDNPTVSWPQQFLGKGRVKVLEQTADIIAVL